MPPQPPAQNWLAWFLNLEMFAYLILVAFFASLGVLCLVLTEAR